jgi:hypothetical protein
MRAVTLLVAVFALVGAVACGPSGPLQVVTVQIGRTLNSDDSVGNISSTFKPTDTVYAAVLFEAAGTGSATVRWRYNGQTVSEETKDVRLTREGAASFHLQPPSAGFPEGDYRAEFEVDGQNAGFREFRVVK